MPKYVSFDPAATPPRLILGWWDTDAFDYAAVPDANARHEVTEAAWQQAIDDAGMHQWALSTAGEIVVYVPPPPPPANYDIPKLVLIDRLTAAGLLRTAFTAMKLDQPYTALSDAELIRRERFNSARVFNNADQDVRTFLAAIGGDVGVLLARPPPNS